MLKFILSIDQSTSATKAVLFDNNARFVARANAEHKQYNPKPGWVEHDPEEIYENVLKVILKVIQQSGVDKSAIKCLSISNQRETVVLWDRATSKPVCNAVVWQCLRGEEICKKLKEEGHEKLVRERTGLIIDPYFSASGLSWIINSKDEIKSKALKGELAAGTIDSWLIWKLTNGKVHATDYSNACRTLLLNIHTLQWDTEICKLFNIPISVLPEIRYADDNFGVTTAGGFFENEIPVCGILGDSHGALFGQRCFHKGLSKVTYGTGSSVMMNIGEKPIEAPKGLVTSVGFAIKGMVNYVFEGNIHSTGATIKWLVDMLGAMKSSSESEMLATSVESTEGVYFVPAFAGLGAPYWNNQARANISGIHAGTTEAHIVRAGLESIAYQVKDLLDLMVQKAGINLEEIRVDGGPTRNQFLMQFQSNMLNAPITVSDIEEASALGAAMAGGIGIGIWENLEELEKLFTNHKKLYPLLKDSEVDRLFLGWKKAIETVIFHANNTLKK